MHKIILSFAIVSFIFSCTVVHDMGETLKMKEYSGPVLDSVTAIKIAIANWYPVYGKKIYKDKPFLANLNNEVWTVTGSLKNGWFGGVPYIEINAKNGNILKITHTK